jgi:hypothetical protein
VRLADPMAQIAQRFRPALSLLIDVAQRGQ